MRLKRIPFILTALLFSTGAFAGTLQTDGGTIYYEKTGVGSPIILLHGGFGDHRMWDDQVQPLAKRYQVIRYDQPGFGKSAKPEKPYSPVAVLAQLMDHLGIQKAVLIGNSMGGILAIDFALMHPDRVDRMVLVGSGPGGIPIPKEDQDRMNAILKAEPEQAIKMWLSEEMVGVTAAKPETKERLEQMVRENVSIFQMRFWPIEKMSPPANQRLAEIKAPTLVIIGDKDTAPVHKIADAAATGIANARKAEIQGADHLPQMTHPEEFNKLVVDFLN